MSETISPSLDQGQKQIFESAFFELSQQKTTKLGGSKAIRNLPIGGKSVNMARIGAVQLTEVEGTNPEKQYGSFNLDNRRLTRSRFSTTIAIDKKTQVAELIKDPTSDLMTQILSAVNREKDRCIIQAAGGSVYTGAPDAAATETDAATDGVITVDATAGLTYAKTMAIVQNFINNELDFEQLGGTVLAISGEEHTQLMSEEKFTSNLYITGSPINGSKMSNAGMFELVRFAGSDTGSLTVDNPILPESGTTRTNFALAPDSIALSAEIDKFSVNPDSPKFVNSQEITVDLWIGAMRTEGARVQKVSTTF